MTKSACQFVGALLVAGGALGLGCAGVKQQPGLTGSSAGSTGAALGPGSAGSSGTAGTSGTIVTPQACDGPGGKCVDFEPTTTTNPVFGPSVDPGAADKFGAPSGNPPCVTEPEDGTLFPNNWLRPRVRVPGNTGLMKITFHAENETTDLVAYATGETWALPKDVWTNLAKHIVEQEISVTVQIQSGGATTVKFQVAPVGAGGSMVFWAADPTQAGKMGVEGMTQAAVANDSYLAGFTVGDEKTATTLTVTDVQQQVLTNDQHNTRTSRCIGCHNGTPDGNYVSFVDAWPWPGVLASVKPDATGKTGAAFPGYEGTSCTTPGTMATCAGTPTEVQFAWNGPMVFSAAHWTADEKLAIVSTQMKDWTQPWSNQNWQPGRLAWLDLTSKATTTTNGLMVPTAGTAYGYLQPMNDPHPASAFPTWSHDGKSIVYVSVACPSPGTQMQCGTQDGRLYKGAADLYEIPFPGIAGGASTPVAATPVNGAATAALEEYYPAFSPDDKFIAYTAVPMGQEMYANTSAELYVVPHGGADKTSAIKLKANTPVQCSGKLSPGVNNHWPKWSPDVKTANNRTYYWLIFSSNRYGLVGQSATTKATVQISQLYITGLLVTETGTVYSYPAIYLWNQPQNRLNTTPAWENFHIPIVIN